MSACGWEVPAGAAAAVSDRAGFAEVGAGGFGVEAVRSLDLLAGDAGGAALLEELSDGREDLGVERSVTGRHEQTVDGAPPGGWVCVVSRPGGRSHGVPTPAR